MKPKSNRSFSRRSFLRGAGVAAGALALSPLIRVKKARAAGGFASNRVVMVAIGGGLRLNESLGMSEGATMPNLFGDIPLVSGFGASPAGAPRIAPEYAGAVPALVTPAPLATPLYTQGTLITNLRYAAGAPGHLQGQACLFSGAYNNIDNRADAHAPAPTLFEIHRREASSPATDAWYVSVVGGFYRAIQASDNPEFGARFGGSFLSPPGPMSAVIPIVTGGRRTIVLDGVTPLPTVQDTPAEAAAVRRLTSVLDGNYPEYPDDGTFRSTPTENAAIQEHYGSFYGDPTYSSYYPDSVGIGLVADDGLDPTSDSLTTYHAERILEKFKPGVMCITLLDIDACHGDFNGYLRGQIIADACVRHLWEFIQSTDGLRDETTLIVLPEHGRHLFHNGQNPDSLGRSGIDHGQGDDGDRNVWALLLGPDIRPDNVIAPTGISQPGRDSGRYESIDATMLAATLLGHGDVMKTALEDQGERPGLMIDEVLL
jgi:hypothetical protein